MTDDRSISTYSRHATKVLGLYDVQVAQPATVLSLFDLIGQKDAIRPNHHHHRVLDCQSIYPDIYIYIYVYIGGSVGHGQHNCIVLPAHYAHGERSCECLV